MTRPPELSRSLPVRLRAADSRSWAQKLIIGLLLIWVAAVALQRESPSASVARDALLREADALLGKAPPSVMHKTVLAASGDPHDYFSVSPCWWPDAEQPKGRPFVWRDGRPNPGNRAGRLDPATFARMSRSVEILASAYRATRRERYAKKAVQFIRVWFLDPATRMNPHLRHADTIPGISATSGHGIFEFRQIVRVLDAVELLDESYAWPAVDRVAWGAWLSSYHGWLTSSEEGQAARSKANHHGSWYDVQVARLALALGCEDEAREILRTALEIRVGLQVQPDGSQPLELARRYPLVAATANAAALVRLGMMADEVGLADWWTHATPASGSVVTALRYLAAMAERSRPDDDDDRASGRRELATLFTQLQRIQGADFVPENARRVAGAGLGGATARAGVTEGSGR